MNAFEIIIGAILIVLSLAVIAVVLLQEGRQANVGVISGAAETFLDKGAAKTLEMKLAKLTKVIAIAFFVLVLAGMLVTRFLTNAALSNSANGAGTTSSTTAHVHDEHDGHTHASTGTTTAAGSTSAATTTTTTKAAQ